MDVYRRKYQLTQKGTIGIVLNTAHFYPLDENSEQDKTAAQRGYGNTRQYDATWNIQYIK